MYDIINKKQFAEVAELNNHKVKMIAPIIITIVMLLYFILYFVFISSLLYVFWRLVFLVIPLVLGGVMIYVCIERINEIKKGEEDDISKY